MSTFIVRVQLTREVTANYTLLRDRLLAIGFSKRIKSKDGIEYRLPNGNYAIISDRDIDTIFDAVKRVALTVDKTPMIVITEAKEKGVMWSGLDRC
jgi:hypothetical protein